MTIIYKFIISLFLILVAPLLILIFNHSIDFIEKVAISVLGGLISLGSAYIIFRLNTDNEAKKIENANIRAARIKLDYFLKSCKTATNMRDGIRQSIENSIGLLNQNISNPPPYLRITDATLYRLKNINFESYFDSMYTLSKGNVNEVDLTAFTNVQKDIDYSYEIFYDLSELHKRFKIAFDTEKESYICLYKLVIEMIKKEPLLFDNIVYKLQVSISHEINYDSLHSFHDNFINKLFKQLEKVSTPTEMQLSILQELEKLRRIYGQIMAHGDSMKKNLEGHQKKILNALGRIEINSDLLHKNFLEKLD